MRDAALTTGLAMGLWVLATSTNGCAPADEAVPTVATDGAAAGAQEMPLPAVSLPDLSPLRASVQDWVRERYAALREIENAGATPAEVGDAHGALGVVLMATNYHDAATTCFRHAQALMPDDMRWPYYLGRIHNALGNATRAAEHFERALELEPTNVPALVSLGEAHLDRGRPEAAAPLFDQAVELASGSAAALAGVGRAAVASEDYLRATEYLERALAADPEASSLHFQLAMAYRAQGQLELAESHLQRRGEGRPALDDPLMEAVRQGPGGISVLLERGGEALSAGRLDEAATVFREAIEMNPDNPELGLWLATTLVAAGDEAGAAEELEATLRRSPEFPNAHFALGSILLSNGRYEDAAERFSAAVRFDAAYLEARIGLGHALRRGGRPEESLQHYEETVSTDPRLIDAWIGAAQALVQLERYEDAREWLDEALRLHPNSRELAAVAETVRAATGSGR